MSSDRNNNTKENERNNVQVDTTDNMTVSADIERLPVSRGNALQKFTDFMDDNIQLFRVSQVRGEKFHHIFPTNVVVASTV